MRLFAGKIRGVALGGLNLNLLAGSYFYKRFTGGSILAVGFQPNFATKDRNVVIDDDAGAGTGPAGLAVGEFVSVVELVGTDAGLNFEPTGARFGAGEQRAVGSGHFGILAVGNRAADEVGGRVALGHGSHRAIQLVLHGDKDRGRGRLGRAGNGEKTASG